MTSRLTATTYHASAAAAPTSTTSGEEQSRLGLRTELHCASERRALEEPAMTEARGRGGRPAVALGGVLGAEAQDAVAPRIGTILVAELFAGRAVGRDHLIDLALHAGCSLRLCGAACQPDQQRV